MDRFKTRACPKSTLARPTSLAVLALAACTPQPQAAGPAPAAQVAFTAGTLTAEDSTRVPVELGEVVVPQLRTGQAGAGPVTLRLVRFRSTSPTPGAPILYLSGGSGAGISAARGPRLALFQALREHGDVVTFDMRGAGRSEPRIACPAGEPLPIATPIVHDTLTAILRRNAQGCAAALRRAGIVPEAFNVREIVADIEAIRAALGAPRIRLWGISTGSQLGLEYIRRHGERVESAVLAGIQAPDQMLDLPGELDRVLESLDAQLQARASASQPATPLIPLLKSVFASLESTPQRVETQDRRTGAIVVVGLAKADAQLVVAGTLGDRRQMAILPRAFGAAARGDYRILAAMKLEGVRGGITSPYELLTDCQVPANRARAARARGQAPGALLGGATLDFPEACSGWGAAPLPAAYGQPVRSDARVLLISGTLDGRTTVENATAALAGLRRGSHLVIEGASHGDDLFLSSPEIVRAIHAHFRGEAAPRTRTIPLAEAPATR